MDNTLKAISKTDDELRVGNYLALWGGRDLTWVTGAKNADGSGGEYFTPETEFESAATKAGQFPVDWEHRRDKSGPGDEVLGYVDWSTAKADERGLWVERVLNRRAKYMRFIERLIEAGLVGSSSEAQEGMVEKADDGRITRWGLRADTLTVTPMEPRMMTDNQLQAVKAAAGEYPELKALFPEFPESIEEPQQAGQSAAVKGDSSDPANQNLTILDKLEESTMSDQTAPENETMKAMNARMDALSNQVSELLKAMQADPAHRDSGMYSDEGGAADKNAKSFADWLLAVQRGDHDRLTKVYATGKALNEATGEAGGYLVPTEYNTRLLEVGYTQSPILQLVQPIPVKGDAGEWPALDQYAAPTAGGGNTALAAGVKATKRTEQSAATETEPSFEMIRWRVHDIGGWTKVSMNLVNDSPQAIESLLTSLFGIAIASKKEYFVLRGSGVGEPLGILNAPAAIGISPDTDNVFAYADAVEMVSRFKQFTANVRWVQHQSLLPDYALSGWTQGDTVFGLTNLGFGAGINSEHLPQANNSGCVLLADFGAYLLFEKGPTEIAFSEHAAFTSRMGTWRFNARVDGQPWMKSYVTLADPQGSYTVSPFIYFND